MMFMRLFLPVTGCGLFLEKKSWYGIPRLVIIVNVKKVYLWARLDDLIIWVKKTNDGDYLLQY